MDTQKKGDLYINGIGSSNGGQFDKVLINGRGSVNSDIDCNEFECNGLGTAKGNIRAEKVIVSGKSKMEGDVNSNEILVEGTAKINGNVEVEKLRISGQTSIGGWLKGEEIQMKGTLSVGGDCEAETFKGEAQFTIGGLLNADEVDIKIFWNCHVKEIGGRTIRVEYKESLVGNLLKPFTRHQLVTDLMEGDKIEVEYTKAKIIRGNDVKIGPNCQIGLIEYTGELTVDKSAEVGETRRV
ncbi:polymer-forming cytoskeletal protein [Neobacillus sp. LXY-1]|uniref:polymer-forming cytoskeletal protein n=1 Tax=Neobacillus sp. LXY-1 TaxID=3379133 RepID=UPI003EE3C01B